MKSIFPFLSTIAAFILLTASAFAQARDWDAILDRYESIYAECVEMKARVAEGGKVSKRKLASLVDELAVLRRTIQDGAGEMNDSQKVRFATIRSKYAVPNKPAVRKDRVPVTASANQSVVESQTPLTERKPVIISVKTVQPVSEKTAQVVQDTFQPLPDMAFCLAADAELAFPEREVVRVCRPAPLQEKQLDDYPWGLSLTGGIYPDLSVGAMLTFIPAAKSIGAYVSYRSDFRPIASSYNCLSDGTSDGYELWLSGATQRHRTMVAAGPVLRLSERFSVYAGIGYGSFIYSWEDVDGNWAEVSDYSCRGFSCEAGLLYDFGRLRIGAGVGVTGLRYSDFEMAVGWRF